MNFCVFPTCCNDSLYEEITLTVIVQAEKKIIIGWTVKYEIKALEKKRNSVYVFS